MRWLDYRHVWKVRVNRFADGLNVGYVRKEEREMKDKFKVFGLNSYHMACHSLRMGKLGRSRFVGIWNQEFSFGRIKSQCLLGIQVKILDQGGYELDPGERSER